MVWLGCRAACPGGWGTLSLPGPGDRQGLSPLGSLGLPPGLPWGEVLPGVEVVPEGEGGAYLGVVVPGGGAYLGVGGPPLLQARPRTAER